jgi:hypothetical protein
MPMTGRQMDKHHRTASPDKEYHLFLYQYNAGNDDGMEGGRGRRNAIRSAAHVRSCCMSEDG